MFYWLDLPSSNSIFPRFVIAASNYYSVLLGYILYNKLKGTNSKYFYGKFIVLLLGILISQFRSVWVSSIITILFVIFITNKFTLNPFKIIRAILFIIIIFYVIDLISGNFLPSIFARVSMIFAGDDPASNYRLLEYGYFLTYFINNPLMGGGFGLLIPVLQVQEGNTEFYTVFAHNGYINLLANAGIIGFSLFLFIVFRKTNSLISEIKKMINKIKIENVFALLLLLNILVMGLFTQNLSQSTGYFELAFVFAIT